jgi:phenylalanine ammonia-lyase
MPLAYVAGTLEGSPDVYVVQRHPGTSARIIPARDALAEMGMTPLRLGPREGLGLVNGTAASAAVASLTMFDAINLTLVSAGLTCLVSEALAARVQWAHSFIANTRPHPGQREVASIMRAFLNGSQLVSGLEKDGDDASQFSRLHARPDGGLTQDRYPLRTSPQWLGPQFEDLLLAHSQITIELNSTSDNPLTDPETDVIYHGGNFQAVSVTLAVEKVRTSLQMVGKLLFAQCTEMINHQMSAGLTPNLAADDPSASFCCKGLDISMAAYQSELSYLSNPMSNHVQSAEMHNQAVNSLALLSTRYTVQAVQVLGLMVANVLYAACQAMDVRVMHSTFLELATTTLSKIYAHYLPSSNECESQSINLPVTEATALRAFQNAWWENSSSDAAERCSLSASAFLRELCEPFPARSGYLFLEAKEMDKLHSELHTSMLETYENHRTKFMQRPTTGQYIGSGSKVLYTWVRSQLGIPMHCGLVDHPVSAWGREDLGGKRTIGSQVSTIYEAVEDGRLFETFCKAIRTMNLGDEGYGNVCYKASD